MIRIALVEDHPSYRETLTSLLNSSPGLSCVAACPNARTALDLLPSTQPDVILMDLHLPGENGLECIRSLRQHVPHARILMLTIEEHSTLVFAALRAGASGYLLKSADPSHLLDAIHDAHAGGAPMSATIARLVVESFHQPSPNGSELADLTQREAEVLAQLARGWTSKEIADALALSPHTILTHIRHIYEKLHVRSRTGAVTKWLAR
jgi:DNA-binding NarL/FixJ family response regulator